MPTVITIPDELFARLQKHAVPFVDTPLTVIERALTALEEGDEDAQIPKGGSDVRAFNPAAAPNLTFSTPQIAKVGKKMLAKAKTYWNPIMYAVIEEAAKRGISQADISSVIAVPYIEGRNEENGYKFVEKANISVQGQDANSAWKQAYRIASSFGIAVEVEFSWQNTEKAAMPNVAGSFYVEGE
ncbi:hypothetical protein GRI44_13055 [Altererythrobacter confluentis]|uniref:Uncharacterized protein n=1 Tax=Allopontixanthobacter confluentis TaxID=1849021 RepID=A0A6L7GLC8_9SPHN|nr:hypothetical protein [Allopontixanthobacter confluentis]MXP15678.1 hypothetical protein [Allopontixanthobacter confluentis]